MVDEYIRLGDVVTLKSGGAKMTVVAINKNSVVVHWFENGSLRMNAYHVSVLTKSN